MTVPALRFSEFEGEWPSLRVGNYLSERSVAPDEGVPLYSLTIEFGVVPKSARYEREFLVKDGQSAYKLMLEGDFAFNPMNLRFGALGRHKGASPVKVSKYYNIFSFSESASKEFFESYLLTNKMIGFYNKMATGSLNEKRRVHYLDFVDFKLPTPSLSEQKKIAAFLGVVDAKIAGLRERRAGLERYKRGLMQALFSQTLRFTKPDGSAFPDWEEKRLGEVLHEHKAKSTGSEQVFSVSVHKGLVNQIEHLGRSFSAANTDHYNRVKQFDIVYTKSPTGDFPLGIIKQNHVDEDVIVSPLYGVFTPETPALGRILHVHFESNINVSNYLSPIVQKGAKNTINVTNSGFLSNKLTLPIDHDEQAKIADALSAMDAKIAAVGDQVARMEAFKKGLLQQMFV